MSDPVIRFVITRINNEGVRTLFGAQQGCNTYPERGAAEDQLKALLANNTADNLSFYGKDFEVRSVECWPHHFDPKTCWFDK